VWLEDGVRLLIDSFPSVADRTPANVRKQMEDGGPLWTKFRNAQRDYKFIGASIARFIEWGEYVFAKNNQNPLKVARQILIECG
jgi:hypothetical protein